MSCGCTNGPIQSWYDLQNTAPLNPLDLITNAQLGVVPGGFTRSTGYITPTAGTWTTTPHTTITGEAIVEALETDNQQMVADAAMWNFSHLTANSTSIVAPPLRSLLFLRGGTQWKMLIPLTFSVNVDTVELSFRDNAATWSCPSTVDTD